MRKLINAISASTTGLLLAPRIIPAFAQNPCPQGFDSLCNINIAESNFVGSIVQILLIVSVIVCVIFLIWGGIRWIQSSGDKGKVEHARSTIIAALIGLIISFLAYFIIRVVLQVVTGSDDIDLEIPTLV